MVDDRQPPLHVEFTSAMATQHLQQADAELGIGELARELERWDRTLEDAGERLAAIYLAGFEAAIQEMAEQLDRQGIGVLMHVDDDIEPS